jgi:HTH-type transcriptional regulator, transcriptional repressor of NAD biosynthesis genes
MSKTLGITIGKFMPLHLGHELMLDFGANMLDHLTVLVSGNETDEIPLSVRFKWVSDYLSKYSNVRVVKHVDESPTPENIDANGTVLDAEFQQYWKHQFFEVDPFATHFVSSDAYGKTMANLLGIKWLRVDPNRETYQISGTQIRKDVYTNFQYISDVAKPYFVKRVAIVGPESTGKSTLTKNLADMFSTVGVHEYGRTISETMNNVLTADDFYNIAEAQQVLLDSAVSKARVPIVFTDTEAYTTYLFSNIYLGQYLEDIKISAIKQDFDLYLVLAPTVKWVDDGTRILSDQADREIFFKQLVEFLQTHNKKYVIIDPPTYSDRIWFAFNAANKIISS